MLVVGLSLLLYPTVSDYWNSLHQSRAIASYVDQISNLKVDDFDKMWHDAIEYNKALAAGNAPFTYDSLLNPAGDGVMGYIEIPALERSFPIYHGTDESVLQVAVGHVDYSSLPTGGESTHCVLSGHRGLPSAKLFTDLDKLQEGDLFFISVLDKLFTYEVDKVSIVLPYEVDSISISPGEDLCTLVTCTPYGVNSHRLLVRGHRVDNIEATEAIRVVSDATQIEPKVTALVIGIPLVSVMIIAYVGSGAKRKIDFEL